MTDAEREIANAELVLADKYELTTFEISDRLSQKSPAYDDFSIICKDLRTSAEMCAASDEMDEAKFYTSLAERIERQASRKVYHETQ